MPALEMSRRCMLQALRLSAGARRRSERASVRCRQAAGVHERYAAHAARAQAAGFSGLLGGFAEERRALEEVAGGIVSEDHPLRENLDAAVARIHANAQWPWHYKVRGVRQMAKVLQRAASPKVLAELRQAEARMAGPR